MTIIKEAKATAISVDQSITVSINSDNEATVNQNETNEVNVRNSDSSTDAEERKIQHWKDSDFAVGCVNITWKDDRPSWYCHQNNTRGGSDVDDKVSLSSIVCGFLGANRVGNMSILSQSTENYEEEITDNETGRVMVRNKERPKLSCVVGPYWSMNFCITFPLIIGVSGWICYSKVSKAHIIVVVTWSIGTVLLLFSLSMISCRNPGILLRHSQIPSNIQTPEDWRWNDQARTYRPSKAKFDTECQVVIEGFDHTCPWTGTAIGSKNMFWFKTFVSLVCVMILYNVCLALFDSFLFPFN